LTQRRGRGRYEGAGPDGDADVHGAVVVFQGEDGAAHGEFHHRRVGEPH
ncbi:unnamed protein product, partial [Musa acuminata subsp. malaccensis]